MSETLTEAFIKGPYELTAGETIYPFLGEDHVGFFFLQNKKKQDLNKTKRSAFSKN